MGRKQHRQVLIIAIGLLIGGVAGSGLIRIPPLADLAAFIPAPATISAPTSAPASAHFGLCHIGGGFNCVVDGDTFWMDGEKIRVADIDAPETHPSRCAYEADLGNRATMRLQELLNDGPVQLESGSRDSDTYGRKLRVVTRNGESLGLRLVNEGLARRWIGSRQPWC